MRARKDRLLLVSGILLNLLVCAGAFLLFTWNHTVNKVELAKERGIYTSAQEGMQAILEDDYQGIERIEYDYVGPNWYDGSNPHVWFVSAKIWARSRFDGSPLHEYGYDYGGSHFLDVGEGWVMAPEHERPGLVGLGMRLFRIYGCDGKDFHCK